MNFHHIGIACENIPEELEKVRNLHHVVRETDIIFDPNQQAEVCIITVEDNLNIEFVSGKPVETLLKKKMTYYHICYEVENLEESIEKLTDNGGFLISPPKEALLFNNRRVCFLMVSYGIVELLERE